MTATAPTSIEARARTFRTCRALLVPSASSTERMVTTGPEA
jgi:hypothetical protein